MSLLDDLFKEKNQELLAAKERWIEQCLGIDEATSWREVLRMMHSMTRIVENDSDMAGATEWIEFEGKRVGQPFRWRFHVVIGDAQ